MSSPIIYFIFCSLEKLIFAKRTNGEYLDKIVSLEIKIRLGFYS